MFGEVKMRLVKKARGICLSFVLGGLLVFLFSVGGGIFSVDSVLASGFLEISKQASASVRIPGEVITYTAIYTIPDGASVISVTMQDCLPNNSPVTEPEFLYIADSSIGPEALTGGTPPISSVVPTNEDACLIWDLGPITNASGQDYVYRFTYAVVVSENSDKNLRNEVGDNSVTLNWDGTESVQASAPVTLSTPYFRTSFFFEGPDGVRYTNSDTIRGLVLGDQITMTAVFSNVAGLNVSPAYSVVLHMYWPEWVTYTQAIHGTVVPTLSTYYYALKTYRELQWFAPNVFSDGVGQDPHLSLVMPGDIYTYTVRGTVLPDIVPNLAQNSPVFGINNALNQSSRLKMLSDSSVFYDDFIVFPESYSNVSLRTADIDVTRITKGGFLETAYLLYGGTTDIITYTISYTLPGGTQIQTPAYFEDCLPDGLHYGGIVDYPLGIFDSNPQFGVGSKFGAPCTTLRWSFLNPLTVTTDLSHTFVYTAELGSHYYINTIKEIPWGQLLRAYAHVNISYGTNTVRSEEISSKPLSFSRPHYGDRGDLGIEAKVGKCLLRDDSCTQAKSELESLSIQCGGTIVFNIGYICNGGFTSNPDLITSTLSAYNTVITDVLPPHFTFVDAWPLTYTLDSVNGQDRVIWDYDEVVPRDYCLPGTVTATAKTEAPYFVVTATVPLTSAAGTTYKNQVNLKYEDVIGSKYLDQEVSLWMIVKIDVTKTGKGIRGSDDVRVGEIVTYTVVDSVPAGSIAEEPYHVDLLPPGVYYIPGSFAIEGASLISTTEPATWFVSGGPFGEPQEQMTWWLETIDNQTAEIATLITMTYQAQVTGIYGDGTPFAENLSQMEGDIKLSSNLRLFWTIPGGAELFSDEVKGIVTLRQPSVNTLRPNIFEKSVLQTSSGNPEIQAGEEVTYRVFVKNIGAAPAYDVVVSDTLPLGTSLKRYSTSIMDSLGTVYPLGMVREPLLTDRELVWGFSALPERPGRFSSIYWTALFITYTVEASDTIGAGAVLSNVFYLMDYSSMPGDQPFERDYGDLYSTTVRSAVLTAAEPIIAKQVISQALRGMPLVYTVTVPESPIGVLLHDVVFTDEIASELDVLDVTVASAAPGVAYSVVGNAIEVTTPFLDKYEQIQMIITTTVLPTATRVISNEAFINWFDASSGGVQHQLSGVAFSEVLEPELVLAKKGRALAPPGRMFTYTLSYTNTGAGIANSVLITDSLPTGISYDGFYYHTRPVTLVSTSPLVWTVGDLFPVERGEIVISVTADMGLPLNTLLENEAELSTLSLGDLSAGNYATVTTLITTTANIRMDEIVSVDSVAPGDLLHYATVYTITGSTVDPAENVTFENLYSPYVEFVSATPAPVGNSDDGDVSWQLGDLPLGTVGTLEVTVRVKSPLTNSLILTNTLIGDADNASLILVEKDVSINSAPELTLSKVASSDGVEPGSLLTYTLTCGNTGDDFARDVILTETYGSNIEFVSASPPPDVGNNVWYFDSIGTQSEPVMLTMRVPVSVPLGGFIVNQVNASASNESEVLTKTITTSIASNFIELSASGALPSVEAGGLLTYTFVYTAGGSVDSLGAVFVDDYSEHTVIEHASPAYDSLTADGAVWELGDLSLGSSGSIEVIVRVNHPLTAGLKLINRAAVSATDTAVTEKVVETSVYGQPDIQLVKSASSPVAPPDSTFVYTITYLNVGTAYASGVSIVENYDPYFDVVDTSLSPDSGDNVWNLGGLGGEIGYLVITGTVKASTPYGYWLTNQVTLTADGGIEVSDSVETLIADGLLDLSKSAPASVDAGDLLVYTLVYTAGGSGPSQGVMLTENYPAGLSFQSAVPSPDFGDNQWSLETLALGESDSIEITLRANSPLTDALLLTNSASITGVNALGSVAQASTEVQSSAQLSLSIETPASIVEIGESVVYTLTYANIGNDYARNAQISLTYDTYLDFVSASPAPDQGDDTWNLGTLGQQSGMIVITATLKSGTPNGAVVSCQAEIAADAASPATAAVNVYNGQSLIFMPMMIKAHSVSLGYLGALGKSITLARSVGLRTPLE